jgi:hypothetical protein
MRAILLLLIFGLLGCSTVLAVIHTGSVHKVRIEDGITKYEGQAVVDLVISNLEKIRGYYISVDAKEEHLVSISKWHTPGVLSVEDLKCKYSANFNYGVFGNNVCIGSESVDKQSLVILGATSWIK